MKRSRINRVSSRRRKENAEYAVERDAYLDRNPLCAVCDEEGRKKRAFFVHHRAGREGRFLLDQRFWMGVCYDCHDRIENFRLWATKNQYLLPRVSYPERFMIKRYGS